jgi:hypothetical protein
MQFVKIRTPFCTLGEALTPHASWWVQSAVFDKKEKIYTMFTRTERVCTLLCGISIKKERRERE